MSTPRVDGIDISHWNSWSGTTELVNWDRVPSYQLIAGDWVEHNGWLRVR